MSLKMTRPTVVAKSLPVELPALTDHCDSVLFVVGLFVLVVNSFEKRTTGAALWAILERALAKTMGLEAAGRLDVAALRERIAGMEEKLRTGVTSLLESQGVREGSGKLVRANPLVNVAFEGEFDKRVRSDAVEHHPTLLLTA